MNPTIYSIRNSNEVEVARLTDMGAAYSAMQRLVDQNPKDTFTLWMKLDQQTKHKGKP